MRGTPHKAWVIPRKTRALRGCYSRRVSFINPSRPVVLRRFLVAGEPVPDTAPNTSLSSDRKCPTDRKTMGLLNEVCTPRRDLPGFTDPFVRRPGRAWDLNRLAGSLGLERRRIWQKEARVKLGMETVSS